MRTFDQFSLHFNCASKGQVSKKTKKKQQLSQALIQIQLHSEEIPVNLAGPLEITRDTAAIGLNWWNEKLLNIWVGTWIDSQSYRRIKDKVGALDKWGEKVFIRRGYWWGQTRLIEQKKVIKKKIFKNQVTRRRFLDHAETPKPSPKNNWERLTKWSCKTSALFYYNRTGMPI